ncbi:MAG: NAD-dependent epimerase/dehydratase family protein [Candidatus Binatia bacterium]
MSKLWLVTGGAGFIGSHIVGELVGRGEAVRVFDSFATGLERNLEAFAGRVDVVRGDLRDAEAVRKAAQGATHVLHLGALGSVPRSVEDPETSNDVNIGGTLNVLVAARDAGAERVVFSSSSSVYGANTEIPKRVGMPTDPVSPYAVTKQAAESYTRAFWRVYGLPTVSLRYFNVFGENQRPDSAYAAVIPKFMDWAMRGEPLVIHGDGLQSRDFTYVDNVVSANLLAATAEGVDGEVYNIACGGSYSLVDIADALQGALGAPIERRHIEARVGDVRASLADIEPAKTRLGYEVLVDFDEGLARTWQSFLRRYAAA